MSNVFQTDREAEVWREAQLKAKVMVRVVLEPEPSLEEAPYNPPTMIERRLREAARLSAFVADQTVLEFRQRNLVRRFEDAVGMYAASGLEGDKELALALYDQVDGLLAPDDLARHRLGVLGELLGRERKMPKIRASEEVGDIVIAVRETVDPHMVVGFKRDGVFEGKFSLATNRAQAIRLSEAIARLAQELPERV